MSDVFISYASSDRAKVQPLVEVLQQQGWSVWWDRTILPGKTWDQAIEAALTDARCVVVLWSRDSVRSDWVRAEAAEAQRRGIFVPALLEDVSIPLAFRSIQAANLIGQSYHPPQAGVEDLTKAVAEILGRSEETATPPPPQRFASPAGTGTSHVRRALLLACASVAAAFLVYKLMTVTPTPPAKPQSPTPGEVRKNPNDELDYVWIPPGKFDMGCSPHDDHCDSDEKPAHPVQITRGFWMGQTEVTTGGYRRHTRRNNVDLRADPRLGDTNLNAGWSDERQPVVSVSWFDAKQYCEDFARCRLPSEAEWEYAARAGTTGARYGTLDAIAWHGDNSGNSPINWSRIEELNKAERAWPLQPSAGERIMEANGNRIHPVARKRPNDWGLYDMLGSVWEWVGDLYQKDYYTYSAAYGVAVDPTGPAGKGISRVRRGGSWLNPPDAIRVSNRRETYARYDYGIGIQEFTTGFRCACDALP